MWGRRLEKGKQRAVVDEVPAPGSGANDTATSASVSQSAGTVAPDSPAPWALITGATSGIGLEFARQLASRGVSLILHGRREEILRAEADAIVREHGVATRLVVGHLGSGPESDATLARILAAAAAVAGANGELLWLVNNAGYGADAGILDDEAANLQQMIRLHCEIPVFLCRAIVPEMVARGGGNVINVGSLAGSIHMPGRSALYSASKDFLRGYTESLFYQTRKSGVRCLVLMPGFVRTDFHARLKFFPRKQENAGLLRWMTAYEVVRRTLRTIEASRFASPFFVPGIANKVLAFLSGIVPLWARKIAAAREIAIEETSRQA